MSATELVAVGAHPPSPREDHGRAKHHTNIMTEIGRRRDRREYGSMCLRQ